MAIKIKHSFIVWHPETGLPCKFEEKEFCFTRPVSRTAARDIVERVEGYVIQKQPRKVQTGPYINKPRARKQRA